MEGRQVEGVPEAELGVGDDRERHRVPPGELDLVGQALRREAGDLGPEAAQLGGVVAKATGLGRAAACARDLVPARQERLPRPPRPRVDVEDAQAGAELGEVDRPGRRLEHEWGDRTPGQVAGGAVVDGDRQPVREDVGVDAHLRQASQIGAWTVV